MGGKADVIEKGDEEGGRGENGGPGGEKAALIVKRQNEK